MSLGDLVAISRYYGSNPEFVLVGGGNTSLKTHDTLYVKASGFALGDIGEKGFAAMDRKKLDRIWSTEYPEDRDEREKQALRDLMNARCEGEEKRPSVEALLHALLPQSFVVHAHPPMINGLTCSQEGKEAADNLFPGRILWIPTVNPGYILAAAVRRELEQFQQRNGRSPEIILLQNHGIFVMAETVGDIKTIYTGVTDTFEHNITRKPDFSGGEAESDTTASLKEQIVLRFNVPMENILFESNREVLAFLTSERAFYPISSAFTPDHIIYSGHAPLFFQDKPEKLGEAMEQHSRKTGKKPKIIAVKGLGFFAVGNNPKSGEAARSLFLDAVKIAVYAESFGGVRFLPKEQIDFILDWEVEQYRSKVSLENKT